MVRRRLFALVWPLALIASAPPVAAGQVTVGILTATQYEYPLFVALVQASGTEPLTDVHLVVNGAAPVAPDRIDEMFVYPGGTYVVWKIFKYATGVVQPGDRLTAVVRDLSTDSGEKTVPCGPGSTKRKSQETAVCRD